MQERGRQILILAVMSVSTLMMSAHPTIGTIDQEMINHLTFVPAYSPCSINCYDIPNIHLGIDRVEFAFDHFSLPMLTNCDCPQPSIDGFLSPHKHLPGVVSGCVFLEKECL